MRLFAIGFLVLSTFLTIGLAFYYLRHGTCKKPATATVPIEGFAERTAKQRIDKASSEASNVLLDVIAKAKRASAHVTDPKIWAERIMFATMSPVELARKHLKAQQEAKKQV
jgi:hypothetical protein